MRTWIEISQEALQANARALQGLVAPGIATCAVVKANAYGHGIDLVVRACQAAGVRHFAVDSVFEAEQVREIVGEEGEIFLLGAQAQEDIDRVIRVRAYQTVSSPEAIQAYAQAAKRLGIPALLTFEIETGLHRLGAQERALHEMVREVRKHAGYVYVQSAASHFASSEDPSALWEVRKQDTVFCDATNWLAEQGISPSYKHIACSAAGLLYTETHHSLIRFGIMLYGIWPSREVRREGTLGKRNVQLTPVLSWKTTVAQIKDVPPGGAIGYGGGFVANRPMRIAILPVGYYDGMDRRAMSQGYVAIRGAKCPIVGRICMNMCMVDIGGAPSSVRAGDTVTLIGRDGITTITADDWAGQWGTIPYEVVTRLGAHIPRVWANDVH